MITYNVEYSYEMKLKKKTLKVNMAFIEVFFYDISQFIRIYACNTEYSIRFVCNKCKAK